MRIEEWWPRLDAETRQWMINNNGDAVPAEILQRIMAVTGDSAAHAPWVGSDDAEGFFLSDTAVDWIEEIANGESPDL
ncbi:hypothetical protein [Paeniglutamicibacter sp. NPDC091659]|uniref:hypothetical protein n=1 Tax=Paeniglutamicibacter sp. NPDC091659 TaxID=3364389 RepID=UPI0038220AD3